MTRLQVVLNVCVGELLLICQKGRTFMLKDTIDKVKAAEKQADGMIADARKKAEAIIQQAYAEAKDSRSRALEQANAEAAEAMNSAQNGSVSRTDAANADVEKEVARLKAGAAEKEETAVNAVIEKIIG